MNTFTRKGYGRIYVDKPENIKNVKQIIKEMDEFEYEYLPDSLIAPFSDYPNLCYTYKFDSIDLNLLTANCWKKGIYIFCLENGNSEYLKP